MITKTDDLLKLIKGGKLDRYDTKQLLKELKEDKRCVNYSSKKEK